MQSNTKAAAKSCGCRQCRRGKRTKAGHFFTHADERAFRREAKRKLALPSLDDVEIAPAPRGGYYG